MTIEHIERLLPPQQKHVSAMVKSLRMNNVVNDHSDPGVGKTIMGLVTASNVSKNIYVVCPKTIIPSWIHWSKTLGIPINITNYEKITRESSGMMLRHEDTNVLEFNDSLSPDTVFILDEAHKCKGWDTVNSEIMIAIKQKGFKMMNLSATLATTPLEVKSLGFVNKLHTCNTTREFMNWCKTLGATDGRFSSINFDPTTPAAKEGMLYMHNRLFVDMKQSYRITVDDMGAYFPDTRILPQSLDMGVNSNKIQKLYDLMDAELTKLDSDTENYSDHVFAIIMKTRRQVELLKVPTIVDMIADYIDAGKSIAVFANFTQTIDVVASKLKKIKTCKDTIVYIKGGQSPKERQENIDEFQANNKHIMLASIYAGGVGVSLHDVKHERQRVSIILPGYSAIQLVQTFGRVRRQGGTKSIQHLIFADGTIENNMCERVQSRVDNISLLNDSDLQDAISFFPRNGVTMEEFMRNSKLNSIDFD